MVFVNGVKYACQSCIKGHRSSSCHHTDRPLFEIKKKGRPITQCEDCRELRKSRKLHVKCCCEGRKVPDEESVVFQSSRPASGSGKKKTVRKIPTIPTLPNGLKDVISRSPLGPAHTKSKITSLLNPCECRGKLTCKCNPAVSSSGSSDSSPTSSITTHPSLAGPARTAITSQRKQQKERQYVKPYPMPKHLCCANVHERVTRKHGNRAPSTKVEALFTAPSTSSRESIIPPRTSTKFAPLPIFVSPPIPTPSTANLTTGSEQNPMEWTCQCGAGCLCLGCKRHQGENASDEPEVLCDENCPTCVDNELGPEMPAILGGTGPVGGRESHCRAHPSSLSGTYLGVASFPPYEEHAETGFRDLGWEDAEGSPDPDFMELPFDVEERCSVDVNVGEKEKGSLGLQVELPKLAQTQRGTHATKNAHSVIASAQQHVRACCARRL